MHVFSDEIIATQGNDGELYWPPGQNHTEYKRLDWLSYPETDLSIKEQIQFMIGQVMPGTIGLVIEELTTEKMVGRIPFQKKTANAGGLMHGGTIFTLGDTLTGCLLWARNPFYRYVTASSEIRFLRPVLNGDLICEASIRERKDNRFRMLAGYKNDNGQRIAQLKIDYVALTLEQINGM